MLSTSVKTPDRGSPTSGKALFLSVLPTGIPDSLVVALFRFIDCLVSFIGFLHGSKFICLCDLFSFRSGFDTLLSQFAFACVGSATSTVVRIPGMRYFRACGRGTMCHLVLHAGARLS